MTPRADDEENLSDFEDDDGWKQDMEALSRACIKTGTRPDDFASLSAGTSAGNTSTACNDRNDSEDRLLDSGDIAVNMTDSDDEQDLEYLRKVQSLYQPLATLPPPMSDDEEDDFQTLRAIVKRFSAYDKGAFDERAEKLAEGDHASSLSIEGEISQSVISNRLNASELCPLSQDGNQTTYFLSENVDMQPISCIETYNAEPSNSSKLPGQGSSFPVSARAFIDAIKKNRSFQRLLRSKLIQLEAKLEQNKQLRERVKCFKDLQTSCIRRTGQALSQKKTSFVQLISAKKSSAFNNSKVNDKKISAMCYGPAENSHVANYRMVLERFPQSLDRKKWSNVERGNLAKGIRQQFQEMVLQISVDRFSSENSSGEAQDFDGILSSIKDLEIKPEQIREFLPKVNWDRLASMYVVGHTAAECEARWLNCEDPLINKDLWTSEEDKSLLYIVQEMGIRNWFDVAVTLGTNRTPFQCLARYQRSLNPSMLYSEWTEEEDTQLCAAVAIYGESNWQSVASVLERRTGTQCSNRWKKSLCPERKGGFTEEEDECLTVAVLLFGRRWKQISKFVPGRTQAQCRDRYVNSLDPSLKWGAWTVEEDSRLKAAIAKHGYCWSKIAEDMPPRTDGQCRKRWKVLCPHEVPLLQAARKRQKAALISNFVDRESERPALCLNDFLPLAMLGPPTDTDSANPPKKQKRNSSNVPKKMRPRKRAKDAQVFPEDVQNTANCDEVETCAEPHLKHNSVEAVVDHPVFSSDSVLMTTNGQSELGKDDTNSGCTEPHIEIPGSMPTCGNPESGTANGGCTEHCGNDSGKSILKRKRKTIGRQERKTKGTEPSERQKEKTRSTEPSERQKEKTRSTEPSERQRRKTRGTEPSERQRRKTRGTEPSEDQPKMIKMSKPEGQSASAQILESQDEDETTIASFLPSKSRKRLSKKATQNPFPFTSEGSESVSHVTEPQDGNQVPTATQDGMSQMSRAGGTSDFLPSNLQPCNDGTMHTRVSPSEPYGIDQVMEHRRVQKPEDISTSTDHDDNMTIACLLRKKSKKQGQAGSSSSLKKSPVLLSEEVHGCDKRRQKLSCNKHGWKPEAGCCGKPLPTLTADGNWEARSEPGERRPVLHEGLTETEHTNINAEGENEATEDTLASFLQKKVRRQRAIRHS